MRFCFALSVSVTRHHVHIYVDKKLARQLRIQWHETGEIYSSRSEILGNVSIRVVNSIRLRVPYENFA